LKATIWNHFLVLQNEIPKWRKKRSLSKAEFAREIGRSRSYVTRLERGDVQASAEALLRIAAFFNRPVEDVFHLVTDENMTFFTSKMLPAGQHKNLISAVAKPMCNSLATPPVRPRREWR
jgi:transcriptional regulator with XRE-family HTH domain